MSIVLYLLEHIFLIAALIQNHISMHFIMMCQNLFSHIISVSPALPRLFLVSCIVGLASQKCLNLLLYVIDFLINKSIHVPICMCSFAQIILLNCFYLDWS